MSNSVREWWRVDGQLLRLSGYTCTRSMFVPERQSLVSLSDDESTVLYRTFRTRRRPFAFTRLREDSLRAGSFPSDLARVARVIEEYGPIDCCIFQYCLGDVPRHCTHYTQNLRRAASAFKWLPHGKISLMGSLIRSFKKEMLTRRK